MSGFITEAKLDEAECEFPGIHTLYLALETKPKTFLELVARYLMLAAPATSSRLTQRGPGGPAATPGP